MYKSAGIGGSSSSRGGGRGGNNSRYNAEAPGPTGGGGGGSSYAASSGGGGHPRMNKTERRGGGGGSNAPMRRGSSNWRPSNASANQNSRNSSTNRPAPAQPPPQAAAVIDLDMAMTACDINRRPPPPPVPIVAPTIEAVGCPTETPRQYDPTKAGVNPLEVIAVAQRLSFVSVADVLEAWRQAELKIKTLEAAAAAAAAAQSAANAAATASGHGDSSAGSSGSKYCYTIGQMLKLRDSVLSHSNEPNFSNGGCSMGLSGSGGGGGGGGGGGQGGGNSQHQNRRNQQNNYSPASQNRINSAANDPLRNREWRAPPPPPPPTKRPELPRPQALRRQTKSLLNKMTVEKFQAIAEMLVKDILEVCADESELAIVVDEVYKKAVSEPDFSEMYADLVLVFRAKSPQFPSQTQGKPTDFKRCIVVRCQREFENMKNPEDEYISSLNEEDAELARMKRKRLILGNMRFIGELYMRKVITTNALRNIVCIMIDTAEPEPHIIECLCELLTTIGYTLDQQCAETSKTILSTLETLKNKFETRINCKIQDLLDLADNGWRQRNLKVKATTLKDVTTQTLESNVAGLQSDFPYKKYVRELDEAYWLRQKEIRQKNKQQQAQAQQAQAQQQAQYTTGSGSK